MTEADWLASADPARMLIYLREKPSNRKRRLLAAACCRREWHRMSDWHCRRAVEVAELFAEGRVTEEELAEAGAAISVGRKVGGAALAEAVASAYSPALNVFGVAWLLQSGQGRPGSPDGTSRRGSLPAEAVLVRCVCGNPFRPVVVDPAWLAWNGGTVPRLAEAAYEERELPGGLLRPQRLALVADALEDAGCCDAELLGHLRSAGPHVRGCWAVDRLTGRE